MADPIIETWEIHNRINLYLLDSIAETSMKDIATSKGRNVGEQFAHVHNVRLMWLKSAAPELMEGVDKIEDKEGITKKILKTALQNSSRAIASMLKKCFEEGKVKGFKPHPTAFLGYIISHESHHRGQIMLCLKQAGHPADKKVSFGLWEWGSR